MEVGDLFSKLMSKLEVWLETAVKMLPNIAVAVVVVLAFAFASKWVGKLVNRLLDRVMKNPQVSQLLSNVARVAVLLTGLFVALGILQLEKTVTSLLAGVGILGLALGFAFQDIAANFVSGVLMAIRRPLQVGDLVKISDYFGHVSAIDLRATRLEKLSGEMVIIPNKDVFGSAIENFTETEYRRVEIDVGVSYGDDLAKAKKLAVEAVEGLSCRDTSRDVDLFYTGFGGSSIDFNIRFWLSDAEQKPYLSARSEAIMAIKQAFDDGDITIPFPIRTLDFGIVGGKELSEALPANAFGGNGTSGGSQGSQRPPTLRPPAQR